MKVNELEGAELDLWVAKSEGIDDLQRSKTIPVHLWQYIETMAGRQPRRLDIDWNFIGPIVERDKIELKCYPENMEGKEIWYSEDWGKVEGREGIKLIDAVPGDTALECLKRCIVKRKYGETIPHD